MAILSKACKPDSFESLNSLKLSFTNIRVIYVVLLSIVIETVFASFLKSTGSNQQNISTWALPL